jgi:hypothetical protein
MKQVFPRFCNPVNPKEPASPVPKEKLKELARIQSEFKLPAVPFIFIEALPEKFPSLHLIESDNP